MARFNGVPIEMLPLLVIFATSFIGQSQVWSNKMDVKVDIVAILPHEPNTAKMADIKLAFKKLPTYYELGLGKAQLAVVSGVVSRIDSPGSFDDYQWVRMNLGSDRDAYERNLDSFEPPVKNEWEMGSYRIHWGKTFDVIRTKIFATPNVGTIERGKAVILIILHLGADMNEDTAKAKTLRDGNVWLFIIAKNKGDVAKSANDMTNNKTRAIIRSENEFDTSSGLVGAMNDVIAAMKRDLCDWNLRCIFTDQNRNKCTHVSSGSHTLPFKTTVGIL